MSNTLSPELQTKIEQEAEVITAGFKDTNDYEAGIIQGYKEGYEDAGDKYALKWEQAEQQLEQMAKALKEVKKGLNWIDSSRELDIIRGAITDYNYYTGEYGKVGNHNSYGRPWRPV